MSKTKKILILSHSSEIGGGELSMINLFEFWTKKNKDIELFFIIKAPTDRLAEELDKRRWQYKAIAYSSWVMPELITRPEDIFRNARMNAKAVKGISKVINEYKPDVVMTNTIIAPWAAFASKMNNIPHVWFVREYGDIDHGHKFEIGREDTFSDIDTLSELVVTNSKALTKHVSKYVQPSKVTTLYTPFDIKKINTLSRKNVSNPFSPKADIKLILTGVIKPSKGHTEVIDAVHKLHGSGIRAELCIVGHASEPEYLAQLKRNIRTMGISKYVHFVGKQANPYPFMARADVGIMASKMEAFGRVTFEYLCLSKPVIGAATGGTLEMVKDGVNGFLFKPGSADEIAEHVKKYVSNPSTLKKHKAEAQTSAVQMISGEYGAEVLIKKIRNVIKSPSTYRLPHFTKRWLDIPSTVDGMSYSPGAIYMIRKAKELGPRATYHRARHKIGLRINKALRAKRQK